MMAGVRASLRTMGLKNGGRISHLVRDLNQMVWQLSPTNAYATMFYARIDLRMRELQYVNAGHERAVLIRKAAKQPLTQGSTGTVLGLSTRTQYEQRSIPLEPGDVLVAVTAGIMEAADAAGNFLDEKLIWTAVRDHPRASSTDLAGHIIQTVDAFTHGVAPEDDRTVIVVRLLEQFVMQFVKNPLERRAFATPPQRNNRAMAPFMKPSTRGGLRTKDS